MDQHLTLPRSPQVHHVPLRGDDGEEIIPISGKLKGTLSQTIKFFATNVTMFARIKFYKYSSSSRPSYVVSMSSPP